MERRYAREQSLPSEEADFLASLNHLRRRARVKQLYNQGWTLQAIADALLQNQKTAPTRSTVHYWVTNAPSDEKIASYGFPPAPKPREVATYQRKTPISPGITPSQAEELERLAPLAREFRSGMASTSAQAVANDNFDALIRELYNQNVTIAEIARAANVTHRAISRRLRKY